MLRTTVPRAWSRGVTRTSVVPATGRLLGPALLLLTLLAAVMTHLADRGYAVVHQCVTLPGAWGVAGMHLALVHETPDCPSGTALGGDPAAVVTVVGALALPVVVAHALAAAVAWGVSTWARRAHERSRAVVTGAARSLRAVVRGNPRPVRGLVAGAPRVARQVPDAVPAALHHLADAVVRTRRGPPRLALV
ncbi:hypothetical protein [Cellulosimicrobium protaetiae]|uniref:Uncharacterized protein n=1 Tax=Cellulosimicrobium protaetiae TaxID=2587808 RepID=A0A6M5UBE8_9MICO|nr:hypothetical protein [Cellulosimicrobium protaetiae]QJW35827.1 hypothetical protein FIC82_006075 [Cellulosimicrobium protaetiae]